MDSALHNFITHTTGSIFGIKLQGEICNAKAKNSPVVTFPTAWNCQNKLTGCLWSYLPCSYSRAGVLVFRCWGPEKAVGMKVAVMACVSCSHSLISWFGPVVMLSKHTLPPNSTTVTKSLVKRLALIIGFHPVQITQESCGLHSHPRPKKRLSW